MPYCYDSAQALLLSLLLCLEVRAIDENNRLETKIELLASRVSALETRAAVDDERYLSIQRRFDDTDKKLGNIDGHISKLVWVVVVAIVGAFIKFAMDGGLKIG